MGLDTPLLGEQDKEEREERRDVSRPPPYAPAPSAPAPAPSAPASTNDPAQEQQKDGEQHKDGEQQKDGEPSVPSLVFGGSAHTLIELCSGCSEKIASDVRFCGRCGTANSAFHDTEVAEECIVAPDGVNSKAKDESGKSDNTFIVQLPPEAVGGQMMQVVVPPGFPSAGEPVHFLVPVEAKGGQRIKVPLPPRVGTETEGGQTPPGGTPVAPGCFRVQMPATVTPGQVMEVAVPPGYPQSGHMARFLAPPHVGAGQYIDVPLPPVAPGGQEMKRTETMQTTAPLAPGCFRVRLPLSAAPGMMLKVTVPPGYVEAGRDQTFIVPMSAPPASLVDVPLPAGIECVLSLSLHTHYIGPSASRSKADVHTHTTHVFSIECVLSLCPIEHHYQASVGGGG